MVLHSLDQFQISVVINSPIPSSEQLIEEYQWWEENVWKVHLVDSEMSDAAKMF